MAKAPDLKPRCHSCRFWLPASEDKSWGLCGSPAGRVIIDTPYVKSQEQVRMTTDLMACSAWVGKE